jgi:beta-galactosidase
VTRLHKLSHRSILTAALLFGLIHLSFMTGTQAQAAERITTATPPLWLGTAWYPEQWPESRWETDLTYMEKAGVRFVRIGEFAWSRMEPEEGKFDFSWMDHAIDAAARHHIYAVLGTPSAAPPAWLTQKYPETLRMKPDGRYDQHGNRQQFNWNNPKYRELAREIARQMAVRYGHSPNVIGWQIDNEYAQESYDPDTKKSFQNWLCARYGTLDNLNARWTTAYWSQSYSDWNQIPIPTGSGNPGLLLSWKRFVSDTWRSYQKNQLEVIRANSTPSQFITTNMMGWFNAYDHYTVSQDLDLASWDNYVGSGHLDPIRNGATHDLTRGFLRKNFWVMETQPGFVNWHAVNSALDKGEVRAMAWHAIGHGSDAVSYWQWRSALNGQEQYHGTLIGADGTPVPLYDEVAQIGKEFALAAPALEGTSVHSQVAILHSYDAFWAIDFQRHNRGYDPIAELIRYYGAVRNIAQSVDIIPPTAPLSSYKLVVAPALNVLSQETADHLIEYVRNGGHLVLGERSGMKDDDNALWQQRQPGPLAQALGGRVAQYYALDNPVPISGEWGNGTSSLWAEQLSTQDPSTQVLMRFGKSNGWLDGQPAAISRKVGKGTITYIGAYLDDQTLNNAAKWMTSMSGVTPEFGPVPQGVDVYARSDKNKRVFILVNFGESEREVSLPEKMHSILEGNDVTSVKLDRFGVAILENKNTGK